MPLLMYDDPARDALTSEAESMKALKRLLTSLTFGHNTLLTHDAAVVRLTFTFVLLRRVCGCSGASSGGCLSTLPFSVVRRLCALTF